MIMDNGILTVEVSEKGAEMVSVLKQGHQMLWNANTDFWNRHAPILFPIVGKLRDDKCRFGARECSMEQHGFARDGQEIKYSMSEMSRQDANLVWDAIDEIEPLITGEDNE